MDGLERMQKRLYERAAGEGGESRAAREPAFHAEYVPPEKGWEGEPIRPAPLPPPPLHTTMSLTKKLFIGSALFFVAAISSASFVLLRGGNVVSSEKVVLQFAGPTTAAGGAPFSFEISVRNDNNIDIESADLVLQFPEGTRRPDSSTTEVRRFREALGALAAGAHLLKKEEVVLFGEEGAQLAITATLEYRVRGSNALLKKSASYEVLLGSAPLSLSIAAPRESADRGDISLVVSIKSNSAETLRGIVVEAEYPFGFTFARSSPRPSGGERLWSVGDLAPGAERTITVQGTLTGAEGDERTVLFRAGTGETDRRALDTALVSASHGVLIRKPFLALALIVGGETGNEFIVEKGRTLRVGVAWENNLPAPATDAQIIVALKGALFDPASVVSEDGGYWRADAGTIVWDASGGGDLNHLAPGSRGQKGFSVNLRGPATGVYALKNPSFTIEASIAARGPVGASESGGALVTKANAAVKLAADLSLAMRVSRFGGPFANAGPLPPEVGAETSYTVLWSLTNAFNDLSGTRVSATLPSYVKFVHAVYPVNERVDYDPVSGALVWEAGELKAGVGIGGAPREVAFQISFAPADNQAGTIPTLVGEAAAEGTDRFTGRTVASATRPPLTTKFSDASFVSGQEVVGK